METTETTPEDQDEAQEPARFHVDLSLIEDLEITVVARVLRAVGLHLVVVATPDDEPSEELPVGRFIADRQARWMNLRAVEPHLSAEADKAPADESDVDFVLRLAQENADQVRTALLPVLTTHPLTRGEVQGEHVRIGFLAERAASLLTWYSAEIDRMRDRHEAERAELRKETDGLEAALRFTQRDYIRVETQRDELRRAVCRAAGIDLDKVSEVDTEYLAIAQELGVENSRLEDNEEFLLRTLHAVMGCCDDPGKCDGKLVTRAENAVRQGIAPEVDPLVFGDLDDVLIESAASFYFITDHINRGEFNIDESFINRMVQYQLTSLHARLNDLPRLRPTSRLVLGLTRLVAEWRLHKRTGKERGTPNGIAADDGYASGRLDSANELEALLDNDTTKGES